MSFPSRTSSFLILTVLAVSWLAASCSPGGGQMGGSPEHEVEEATGSSHEEDGEHGDDEHDGIVELTPEAASRAEIRTAAVESRAFGAELETTGQVDFDRNRLAHVSPRIEGRVHRVQARLGQRVKAGQPMAQLDSIELGKTKAEYLRAQARLDLARENLEREEKLYVDRITSEQEVIEARSAFRQATVDLATTGETLRLVGLGQEEVEALHYDDPQASLYTVRAPFDGQVVEKHVTIGELVTPDRNIFTVADLDRVWIWIDVYERDLRGVHLEDQAEVEVDAYPGALFRGLVSYLSAQVDTDTRTVRARIDVPNPEEKLRPGMFARVRLFDPHGAQGRLETTKSLVVPGDAVQRDGDESIVFVPTGPLTFERREVRTGRKAGGLVEILGGLEAGEQVVVAGAFLLKSEALKESMGAGHEH